MERVDCDEDVSHVRVNLISSIAALKLLCDCVLETKSIKHASLGYTVNIGFRAIPAEACNMCYINVLSSCHAVINCPGQAHQQQHHLHQHDQGSSG